LLSVIPPNAILLNAVALKNDSVILANFPRELISVDDDYVAEHEAKLLKEADLQEKILQVSIP
jgi:hypothetical protein